MYSGEWTVRACWTIVALIIALPGCAPRAMTPTSVAIPLHVPGPCRVVGDVASRDGRPGFIRIAPGAAARLAAIGLDRAAIFARMHDTSIPETTGCWAMPTGNFDSQLVSVGMAQWNFGTGRLHPMLPRWRAGFHTRRRFREA